MTRRCGTRRGYADHMIAGTPYCDSCRAANATAKGDYLRRRYLNRGPLLVDATGTGRRLRALAAMGWSTAALGERLGVHRNAVNRWSREPRITRENAARVAEIYDELWDKPGPAPLTAKYAARAGWPPPLAWDDDRIDDPKARPSRMVHHRPAFDEIAVQRAMRGDRVHLRPVERAEAVRRLTAQGRSTAEIADRLRIEKRSAIRIRSEGRRTA